MTLASPMLSVIVPVYGASDLLGALCQRTESSLRQAGVSYEMVLVDDCGPGDVWATLVDLREQFPQVACIQLMRNFGQHNALMCGFQHARGQFVVTMDDDLQHEPESIPRLLNRLHETGADLVYGVYDQKRHGRGRNLGSWLVTQFYRVIFKAPVSPTSFRAIRRELVEAILRYDLNFTYVDGLLAWNTQRIKQVTVPHHERADGRSGYTLSKLVNLAMNVFTNFSLIPLQLVSFVGCFSAVGGLGLGVWYLVAALFAQIAVPGYASIIVAVLVLGGLQLLSLGIIGEYLGRLHLNVNRKPQYTIRQMLEGSPASDFMSAQRAPLPPESRSTLEWSDADVPTHR